MLIQMNPVSVFAETFRSILSPLTIFIWLTCIILATLSGPFGTYEGMDWPTRTLYWSCIVTAAVVFGYAARALAVLVIGYSRPILFDLFAAGLMALVFGPMVWIVRVLFQPDVLGGDLQIERVVIHTFVIAAGVFVLRRQICVTEPGAYLTTDPSPPHDDDDQPRLLRRLPEDMRGAVLRLSANDHYVQVVTSHGAEVLRLRLSDAIDEMEPVEGYCTHRSHWVARQAIAGVERENAHKLFLVLTNGDRVPVSRKFRPTLEREGIIEPAGSREPATVGKS